MPDRSQPEMSTSGRWAEVDRAVLAFEAAWRVGRRPDPADFLPQGPARQAALRELVHVDLERRLGAGEPARVEDYLARFPELADDDEVVLGLAVREFYLRKPLEPGLAADEYLARFPALADRLRPRLLSADVPTTNALADTPGVFGRGDAARPAGPPAGPFEMLGELGRGGMGVVYKARDRSTGQVVALKEMRQSSPEALYRFKREFRSRAELSHENLVRLYELFAEGDQWFFTMELVEGVDFLSYARHGHERPAGVGATQLPMDAAAVGRLREALRQLAAGVTAVHGAGLLHRDLKPGNVLVTAAGRVVVLDFGLVAELDRASSLNSMEGWLLGTVPYMAPEQAAGQRLTPAADWYSVGVMLYEALTGQLPYRGQAWQVMWEKQERDAERPGALAPKIPAELDALCVGLLRREAASRYGAREVRAWLAGTAVGESASSSLVEKGATGRTPFVGRKAQLQALTEAYEAVRGGRPVVVRVHGPSGAGKSAVVQRFLERLDEAETAVVLRGRCYEQESVPYKALDSLIDALSRYLRHLTSLEAQALLPREIAYLLRVFPALGRVEAVAQAPHRLVDSRDEHESRRRAFTALRELLGRLADRRPLVLVIDDLQWGDLDSATMITEMLRPPDPPALLFIGCYRQEDVKRSPCLRFLYEAGERVTTKELDQRDLDIEPLDPADARSLATALLGAEASDQDAQVEAIAQESGGLPFFIHELACYAQIRSHTTLSSVLTKEVALDQFLWTRIEQLPRNTRRLLEIVAIAGQPLGRTEACQIAGLAGGGLPELAVLRAQRLIRGSGSASHQELDTYHDRVRETVVARLAPQEMQQYHRGLATVLEASGREDAEALAVHFEGAGDNARAGYYFARAAEKAAGSLAFDHAARLYRFALRMLPTDLQETRELWRNLGKALANAGRGAEAAEAYLTAARDAPAAEGLRVRQLAAMQYLASGHIDEGLTVLHTVLKDIGMRMPSATWKTWFELMYCRCQLWLRVPSLRLRYPKEVSSDESTRFDICWDACKGLSFVDTFRGYYFANRALLLALRIGDPCRIAPFLALEGCYESVLGGRGVKRGTRRIEAAEKMLPPGDHPYEEAMILFCRGTAAYMSGFFQDGLQLVDRAEKCYREHCTGVAWELDVCHTVSLWSLAYLGKIGELTHRYIELLREAGSHGNRFVVTTFSTYIMAIVRLAADATEEADRTLNEVMKEWSQQGYHVQHHNAMLARVLIDLYRGDSRGAWGYVSAAYVAMTRSRMGLVEHIYIDTLQSHGRAALAMAFESANPRDFLGHVRTDARRLGRFAHGWPRSWSILLRAGVARVEGQMDQARKLLAEAANSFEALGMRLHAEAARRRLGGLLGGDEGRRLIEEVDARMISWQVRNPSRFTAMYAPGFSE
jgi:eukaryotic-like serine/threonine-protein kinase